jgi:hypothetical protein
MYVFGRIMAKQKDIALGRELAVYRHLNLYRFNSLASALLASEIKTIRPC